MNATTERRLPAAVVLSLAVAAALAACGPGTPKDKPGPSPQATLRSASPSPSPSPSHAWPADCATLLNSFASATFSAPSVESESSSDVPTQTLCAVTGHSSRLRAPVAMIVAVVDPTRSAPAASPTPTEKALKADANEKINEVCAASLPDFSNPGGPDKRYGAPVTVTGTFDYAKGCTAVIGGNTRAGVAVVTKGLSIVALVRTNTKLKEKTPAGR